MLPFIPDLLNTVQQNALNRYPTYQKFFEDFKPAQLLVNFDEINTIEQSISETRLTIGDLRLIYPDDKRNVSVDYLINWLSFLNRISNINKPLIEVEPVAYMLFKDYKYLYLTDFKIIFERILRAEYGVFYGSVDAQLILRSFVQYTNERRLISKKNRTESLIETSNKKPEKSPLKKHLEKIESDVRYEVHLIMKEKYFHLTGYLFLSMRDSLIDQKLPEALRKGEEEFNSKHVAEKQISR